MGFEICASPHLTADHNVGGTWPGDTQGTRKGGSCKQLVPFQHTRVLYLCATVSSLPI